MRTIGISPKVLWPFATQLVIGVVLLVAGERDTAVGVLLAAGTGGAIGHRAQPGRVRDRTVRRP